MEQQHRQHHSITNNQHFHRFRQNSWKFRPVIHILAHYFTSLTFSLLCCLSISLSSFVHWYDFREVCIVMGIYTNMFCKCHVYVKIKLDLSISEKSIIKLQEHHNLYNFSEQELPTSVCIKWITFTEPNKSNKYNCSKNIYIFFEVVKLMPCLCLFLFHVSISAICSYHFST